MYCIHANQKKAKHELHTLGQFLSKVAFYLRYGYFRYAVREIPAGKDLARIDEKILGDYEVTYRRIVRARRKKKGLANVVYIRFGQTFILMATSGEHTAFNSIVSRDFREVPFHFSGYSIGIKNNKPHIIIEPKRFERIHRRAHKIALHNLGRITAYLHSMSPFRFAGVNEQRWKLFRQINRRRKVAQLPRITWEELKTFPKKRECSTAELTGRSVKKVNAPK